MGNKKLTDKLLQLSKSDLMMSTVAKRAGYYRANPHRFAEDYLNVHLKLFLKILIYVMMVYDYFFFIAARGKQLYLWAFNCILILLIGIRLLF